MGSTCGAKESARQGHKRSLANHLDLRPQLRVPAHHALRAHDTDVVGIGAERADRFCDGDRVRPCTPPAAQRSTATSPSRGLSLCTPQARALHFRSSRRACHRCVPRMPAHVRRSPHARKSPPGAYPRTLCGYPNSRACSASSSPRVHSGALTPLRSYSRISSSRGPSSGCQHSTRSAVTVHTCLANALKDVMSPSSGMASGSAAPQQCKVWSLVSAHE